MHQTFLKGLFSLLVIVCTQFYASATHIIGGELMVVWSGKGTIYTIYLERYLNENSVISYGLSIENTLTVNIYDYNTGRLLAIQPLDLSTNQSVTSNSNYCANTAIVNTTRQMYQGNIDLGYLDPNGSYYVTWEECCRNESITNIVNPVNQDIVLYTQFPGTNTRNSSPIFKVLQNEFFCRNTLNTFDMSATDNDGDKLVYSLVSPRQYQNPFGDVDWYPGYSGYYPIPGSVPLNINPQTGLLSFNPSQLGVFLFGITVEEYRNGIKIGEVRKDYQFNVQDCPVNRKPVVGLRQNPSIDGDTLIIQLKDNKCFPLYVTDVDASVYGISENIYIKFSSKFSASAISLPASVSLNALKDTANFSICIQPCLNTSLKQTTTYPAQIVINDDRCPAQYDTLNFIIKVVVVNTYIPKVFINPPTNPKVVKVDSLLSFKVYGTDQDPTEILSLSINNRQRNMRFQDVTDSLSTISSLFTWTPNCNDVRPGTYDVSFIIKDNSCLNNHADTVSQTIIVQDNETSFAGVKPTNLITPNGDGLNDCYQVLYIPEGNCEIYFRSIEIYNRWGARVFYSEDRFFKWCPDVSDGVYYYSIDLKQEVKKGWLQVTQ
jgi:hypothetical protein